MNSRKSSNDQAALSRNIRSELSLPKPLNRSAFKEQLQSLKSLTESEYKTNLAQLLASYNSREVGEKSFLKSNTSFRSSNPGTKSSHLTLPTLRLPPKLGGSIKDLSPNGSNKTSEKTLELFAPTRTKPSIKLSPINSVKNIVNKVAFESKPGKLRGTTRLHNQDRLKIVSQIHNVKGQFMFAAIDGHGAHGHYISEFIKKSFSKQIKQTFPPQPTPDSIKKTIEKALEHTIKDLNTQQFNLIFSGATFTTLIITGNTVICGNIGTCKVVLAQELDQWQASELTVDHSLKNPKERQRMISYNSRIVNSTDMYGFNSEIFYTNSENVPGLEITRSIGDKIGKFVGMNSIIDFKSWEINANHKFLVIGTENLWKALSPIEAVCIARLGWENNSADQSCEDLLAQAERILKESVGIVEDLSVIVIFFEC